METDIINYRLSNSQQEYDVVCDVLFASDIAKYNASVAMIKTMNENPWFSWFINDKLAESVEYVDLMDK